MSRRSHRHGDRGHGRPPRLELTHPSSPAPGPVEAFGAPERPASTILARPTSPVAEITPTPTPTATPTATPTPAQALTPSPMPAMDAHAVELAAAGTPPLSEAVDRVEPADGSMALDPNRSAGCTSPQLRRFIKSRAYIPMHELRRRFAINGPEDDVAAIDVDGTRLYVGLPEREGRLLGELLRGGDVGAELSHDPVTPIIVGVYPMRPVPRG
jgi:hypothetical protein